MRTAKVFDADSDNEAGDPGLWEPVRRSRARKAPGVVLSVRLSQELAKGLEGIAGAHGVTTSEAARQAIHDAVVKGRVWSNPTLNLAVRDLWSVTYTQGDSSKGGESKVRRFDEIVDPA